jgi:hypothetical protein
MISNDGRPDGMRILSFPAILVSAPKSGKAIPATIHRLTALIENVSMKPQISPVDNITSTYATEDFKLNDIASALAKTTVSDSRVLGALQLRKLSKAPPAAGAKITLAQAGDFIELLPEVTCILDVSGNILIGNKAFMATVPFATNTFLGVITSVDAVSFSHNLLTLKTSTCNEFDSIYSTNCQNVPSVSYCWHLATTPCKAFIVASGRPSDPLARISPEQLLNDAKALKQIAINAKATEHQPIVVTVTAVQNLLTSVEADAKMTIELKASELKAEALENTLEMKRVFVRHVSHEIRTPLSIVASGIAYLFTLKSQMTQEVFDIIDEVRSACGTAIDVTNDILTYEKIDSNILTLENGPTDIVEVATGVCTMFQIQARSSEIELVLDKTALRQERLIVHGDSSKLAQVFRNLVSNAVKFTPAGGRVTLTLSKALDTKRECATPGRV